VSSEQEKSGNGTVLVVDDDEDLLEIVREVIVQEGFDVMVARDGAEALEKMRKGKVPCLILLDLKMPGMSGQEFRRRQLEDERFAGVPVVGFTGVSNGEGEAQLLALSSYLRKPVHLHHLLETVSHYCSDPDHVEPASRAS
jgi:CheY-like chemotaxis protein